MLRSTAEVYLYEIKIRRALEASGGRTSLEVSVVERNTLVTGCLENGSRGGMLS